jgi:hypothetical protein
MLVGWWGDGEGGVMLDGFGPPVCGYNHWRSFAYQGQAQDLAGAIQT